MNRSMCWAPCRRVAGSGLHTPVKRGIVSSSATARRKLWARASARPSSGSAWEASHPSSSLWFCWSWGSLSRCLDSISARSRLRLRLSARRLRRLVSISACWSLSCWHGRGLGGLEDYGLGLRRFRPAFEDEVIEVRQRLGQGEAALMIRQGAAEHLAGDFVRRLRTVRYLSPHHF